MYHPDLFFVNVLLATICLTLTYASLDQKDSRSVDAKMLDTDDHIMPSDLEETISSSLRWSRRFRGQKRLPASYTCNKFPRACRLKGSAGPDCCKKKCVNIRKDRLNCGCVGTNASTMKCVNASIDRKHCGGCQNKCKKGDVCVFGMCSYA